MFKRYFIVKFFLFFLLLFCINLFLRKSAPVSYSALLDYNQLYFDRDKIHIADFILSHDSLQISFMGKLLDHPENKYQVFSGKRLIYEGLSKENTIRFRLDSAGINRVSVLVNGSKDSLVMNIDFSPDSVYKKQDNGSDQVYELTTNVPVHTGRLYAVTDWAIRYPEDQTIPEDREINLILRDSAKIQQSDPSQGKVLKIARFILARTAGKEGIPSDELSRLSPLAQLRYIQAGKSKAWCGNFSSIFSFLASAAGLPVRLVSCGQSQGRVSTGVHVFCEVYLKETQSWAYVDLTSRNILVSYQQKWLNVVDIQRLLRYSVQDSDFVAWHYEKDSLYKVPFSRVQSLAAYYFHSNALFTFYFGDYLRIQRPANIFSRGIKFFYSKPYYAIYSDNIPRWNDAFYLRVLTNYILAIMFLAGIIALIRKIL